MKIKALLPILSLLVAVVCLTGCTAEDADVIGWTHFNVIGQFDADGNRIINVATPTLDDDAATKEYVDDEISGISHHRILPDGTGGYWHEYSMPAIDLSPGASGATQIAPNASSLGGYQLNGITEYIFYGSHIEDDWDGVSPGMFEIYFEVNDDNSGGLVTDTVKFQLEVWHKATGELVNTVYSLSGNTVVGQATQHKSFIQIITIDNLRYNEVIAFRLNLNTILSQVTDVIVNIVEFKFPVYPPAMER